MNEEKKRNGMTPDGQIAETPIFPEFQKSNSAFKVEPFKQVDGNTIDTRNSQEELSTDGSVETVIDKVTNREAAKPTGSTDSLEYPKLFYDSHYYAQSSAPEKIEQPAASMPAIGIGNIFPTRVEVARIEKPSKGIDMAELEFMRPDNEIRQRISIALIIVLSVLFAGVLAGAIVAFFL